MRFFPKLNRPGREVHRSSPSSAEYKHICTSPVRFRDVEEGQLCLRSQDDIVSIVTSLLFGKSSRGKILFSRTLILPLGTTQPLNQKVPGASNAGIERPWRKADHIPPCVEVKSECS